MAGLRPPFGSERSGEEGLPRIRPDFVASPSVTVKREVILDNKLGLDSSPSRAVVGFLHHLKKNFEVETKLTNMSNGRSANGAQFMEVLSLDAADKCRLRVSMSGEQNRDCLVKALDLFEKLLHDPAALEQPHGEEKYVGGLSDAGLVSVFQKYQGGE